MKGSKNEVWVTSARSKDEARKCLVLAKSLKMSFTSRPTAIFITAGFDPILRNALTNAFDHTYVLEDDACPLEFHDFAKISVLKLLSFEKCVYLAPNSLVLRNADEIFNFGDDEMNNNSHLILSKEGADFMSIFAVRPALKHYYSTLKTAINSKASLQKTLHSYFIGKGLEVGYFDDKFCATIKSGGYSIRNSDVSIVTFEEDPLALAGKNLGILENLVVNMWMAMNEEIDLTFATFPMSMEITEDRVDYVKEPIAIVGMSCRYPNSNNLEEFWKVLIEGKDCIRMPPPSRFKHIDDPEKIIPGGYLDIPLDEFDAKFFGISPAEVLQMDPQHRLLHEVIWEALEDAGIDATKLNFTNSGVFYGSWKMDFKEILTEAGYTEFYRKYMGNSMGAGAARISFNLGITGPCIATENGCSSSMSAVHLACKSLVSHETNLAIACGANLILNPIGVNDLIMLLAPNGRCKTLDVKADGYGRAEGLGVLILKRLSDAVRDNDRICALIRGSALTQEGASKSLGTPTVHCESLAMRQALKDANVMPEQVSFVEMHGSGTPTGDPVEVESIAKAYYSPKRKEPLVIGSAKVNVSHTESCSGMVGIMKVALQMKYGMIPPHRNLEELNPVINLASVPAKVPMEALEWKIADGGRRIAGVSSFGITGTDAHMIMEEPPEKMTKFVTAFDRPLNILKISAKSEEAFQSLLGKYLDHLRICSGTDSIEDICYTGNVGRGDFPFRACVIVNSRQQLISILENKIVEERKIPEGRGKICFLFTGQGSQYPGMAKKLYETSPVFRIHFDYCANLLDTKYHVNLRKVLWSEDLDGNGNLNKSIYSQTGIFVVEYALFKLWESWGITPDYCLGHSMGEFAASACAGILSVEDALKLVTSRSLLIEGRCSPGKMLVIQADQSSVKEIMSAFASKDNSKMLDFAAINSPEQIVVSGDSEIIVEFANYLKSEEGLKCVVLQAKHAFHSKHMDNIQVEYAVVAASVQTRHASKWKCDYISGLTGKLLTEGRELGANYWLNHSRQPVNFLEASNTATNLGSTIFLEIGPQPILSALQMMNNPDLRITCLPSLKKNKDNWTTILKSLKTLYTSGFNVNWIGFDKLYDRTKVSLPTYPFIGKKFWPEDLRNFGKKKLIHPLLGSSIPNATSKRIFQVGLNLNDLEYLREHQIGEYVVYPGACFLETMLAAGMASFGSNDLGKNRMTLKLENVVIDAPLRLVENTTSVLQVVVGEPEENGGLPINIFRIMMEEGSEEGDCRQHSRGTIVPLPSEDERLFAVDLEKFEKAKHSDGGNEKLVADTYQRFDALGLRFGDTFRSIENVWNLDGDGGILLAKVKLPKTDRKGYIVHPVIIDAMLQAILILNDEEALKRKMVLPVRINKFVWIGVTGENVQNQDDEELYIHVFNSNSAVLLTSSGSPIAIMSQVDFVDTTVSSVTSILEQQTSKLPTLWEEVWKGASGTMKDRLKLDSMPAKFYSDEFLERIRNTFNVLREDNLRIWELLHQFVCLNMLKGLYACGWKIENENEEIDFENLFESLGILEKHKRIVGFYLTIFEEEGYLEKANEKNWKVRRMLPSKEQVKEQLESSVFSEELVQMFESTKLLKVIGDNLGEILRGEKEALPILFPDSFQDHPSVHHFYEEYTSRVQGTELVAQIVEARVNFWREQMTGENFVLRIIEFGSGTGGYTQIWIDALEKLGVQYEFYYTDISQAFFPAAEIKFEKYKGKIRFQRFNLEEDPLNQGFLPEYFDYAVASETIHATRNIRGSLGNVWKILRNGGGFDIFEQTKVNRIISLVFGCLDGFWSFEDFDLRHSHCTMSVDQWKQAFQESGYTFTEVFHCCQDSHGLICAQKQELDMSDPIIGKEERIWIVFKPKGDSSLVEELINKLRMACRRRVIVVEPGLNYVETSKDEYIIKDNSKEDVERILEKIFLNSSHSAEGVVYAWGLDTTRSNSTQTLLQPYLNAIQCLSKLKRYQRSVVLTNGVCPLREQSLSGCYQSTLWGFTKSLMHEDSEAKCRCIDVSEATFPQIFHEIWRTDKESQVFLSSDHIRFVPKLQNITSHSSLSLPSKTDRFQVVLPESRQMADLTFAPLTNFNLQSRQVEVEIRAVGLNFRDTFAVLKPSEYFQSVNAIGLDVAGVVKRVGNSVKKWEAGDRVFWMTEDAFNMAFPSHRVTDELDLVRIPEGISFAEGATLPSSFITAHVSLVEVANVKPNDVVLIHTASGGVGLSCIEVCKYLGVPVKNIICTAGSERKWNFLRESYGIVHVFSSRNTDYSSKILELTGGNGVDVVVNTLTSKGFKEASLRCVAQNGRFIELSKLNVWRKEDVLEMRSDVKYDILDVSSTGMQHRSRLLDTLVELISKKTISPLPYSRFDGVDLRQALEYLQKAKHLGKVVCGMPQRKLLEGRVAVHSPMFHENGTYLITGGLGGIGFEVAKWMLKQGGRHLLLIGRNPPNETIEREIGNMNAGGGTHIVTAEVDVSNYAELKDLLENLSTFELPPLKGVMHCGGALADGLISTFEWERFSIPFQAKIDGTLNLHELTTHIKLEHFVLFSSAAALFGTPGQSNHVAGNCFEDAFAHFRYSHGLPVTTVNWGAWAEVGAAAQLVFPGFKGMSTEQGLAALEFALKSQRTQMGAFNITTFEKVIKWLPHSETYFDKKGWPREDDNTSDSTTSITKSTTFWNEYNGSQENESKLKVIDGSIQRILRKILKLTEREVIGAEDGFAELGLDSLMFLELSNEIRCLVGDKVALNVRVIRDANTLRMLTSTMFNLLEGNEKELDVVRPPTYEEVTKLMKEDYLLPEHIRAKPQQILGQLEDGKGKNILLTGATGTLGPYILGALCNLPQIESVYCLVRRRKTEPVSTRLKKWLGGKSLLDSIGMSKVIAVEGDVALPQLGMRDSDWTELIDKCEAVFHCAAHVDHVEYYRPKAHARSVNIQGTINVLEFASSGDKLKHVYYASTLLACGSRRSKWGTLIEEWPQDGDFDNVTIFAYPVSKFCAEMIMKEACVARGIPCKSFRFPLVTGDSSTGQFTIDQNHFMLRYFYMMKTGIMPSLPFPVALLPVDICARVSVSLFLNSEVPPDVYNITHPLPNQDEEFVGLAMKKFGKHIRMVDFDQFTQRLRDETDDNTQITLFREWYNDDDVYMTHYKALLDGWLEKKEDFWRSKKVGKYLPHFFPSLESTLEYLERDLKFAKNEGVFERFGL